MSEAPAELDPRMIAQKPDENGLVWFDVTEAPFDLYGFYDVNPFRRLPESVAEATNDGVRRNNFHTAGGRVRFSTDSTRIAVRAKMQYVTKFMHMPLTGTSSFDVYIDTEYGSRFRYCYKPDVKITDGFTGSAKIGGKRLRYYTVNFPLYNPVERLEIGIDAGSALGHGMKYLPVLPVVFYGSSITQGGCASRPGLCYQAHISRRLNIDHINLGFSGNARGELPIVEYMAGMKMSAFVSDYDHNAPNAEHLRDTHYRMYQKIREKNPDIPYIMLTKPDYFPDYEDNDRRRDVVIDTYRRARADGDANVWYIDGDGFFRGVDEDCCTVDGTHPNDLGFLKMADAVGRILRRVMRSGLKPDENA